jgi:8-oxo-dGTP pyrophosphatase MutT (NUDIX family)
VVRHHKIDFAGGALVFPGGAVERGDFEIAADPARCAATAREDEAGRAFRVAAIRETFEECGVLLARRHGSSALIEGTLARAIAVKAPERDFGGLIAEEGLTLAVDALTPFAHWITPPILPKRFDTHFYIVAAPSNQAALHDGSEAVDSLWINPAAALASADAGRRTLVLATRLNLAMLGESRSVADALANARARRIVTVEPKAVESEAGFTLTIPREAGYGERTSFEI